MGFADENEPSRTHWLNFVEANLVLCGRTRNLNRMPQCWLVISAGQVERSVVIFVVF